MRFFKKDANVFNVKPYEAPELAGLGKWFNSDSLNLADLKGQVVLVDFWAFGCINCVRTIPYVESWYQKYKDQDFVVIGVHTPEFDTEKDADNLARQIEFRKITYPVVQDNDYATWNAYKNKYWPAQYLIDKSGQVQRTHFGEGEYKETEQAIAKLLSEE